MTTEKPWKLAGLVRGSGLMASLNGVEKTDESKPESKTSVTPGASIGGAMRPGRRPDGDQAPARKPLVSPPPGPIGPGVETRQGGRGGGPGGLEVLRWEIELPWPDRTGNRAVRHGGGGHYLSREAQAYRSLVRRRLEAARLADRQLAGPYLVRLVLQPPDDRARDGDNLEKVLWDAIVKAGLLVDDSNRVLPRVYREWVDPEYPGSIFINAEAL